MDSVPLLPEPPATVQPATVAATTVLFPTASVVPFVYHQTSCHFRSLNSLGRTQYATMYITFIATALALSASVVSA
jgi:hypothetical protein